VKGCRSICNRSNETGEKGNESDLRRRGRERWKERAGRKEGLVNKRFDRTPMMEASADRAVNAGD
jgi:hypothetical protein